MFKLTQVNYTYMIFYIQFVYIYTSSSNISPPGNNNYTAASVWSTLNDGAPSFARDSRAYGRVIRNPTPISHVP